MLFYYFSKWCFHYLSYRPYHPHDRIEPLEPNEVYECDIEVL